MKTMKLFMLLAAVLLSSASAFAQSGNSEPLKGDVNEDGKVDFADVAAILQIMKDGGGTSGETIYYWYVGQTDPSTMTSISPIVTNYTSDSPGWRLIEDDLSTYGPSKKVWSYTNGDINMDQLNYLYIAVPNTTLMPHDGLGVSGIDNGSYEKLPNTKTLNGVTYTIYKSTSQWLMAFTEDIY